MTVKVEAKGKARAGGQTRRGKWKRRADNTTLGSRTQPLKSEILGWLTSEHIRAVYAEQGTHLDAPRRSGWAPVRDNPSAAVYLGPDERWRGWYRDLGGAGESMNIIDWMISHGHTYGTAIRELADLTGVELPRHAPPRRRRKPIPDGPLGSAYFRSLAGRSCTGIPGWRQDRVYLVRMHGRPSAHWDDAAGRAVVSYDPRRAYHSIRSHLEACATDHVAWRHGDDLAVLCTSTVWSDRPGKWIDLSGDHHPAMLGWAVDRSQVLGTSAAWCPDDDSGSGQDSYGRHIERLLDQASGDGATSDLYIADALGQRAPERHDLAFRIMCDGEHVVCGDHDKQCPRTWILHCTKPGLAVDIRKTCGRRNCCAANCVHYAIDQWADHLYHVMQEHGDVFIAEVEHGDVARLRWSDLRGQPYAWQRVSETRTVVYAPARFRGSERLPLSLVPEVVQAGTKLALLTTDHAQPIRAAGEWRRPKRKSDYELATVIDPRATVSVRKLVAEKIGARILDARQRDRCEHHLRMAIPADWSPGRYAAAVRDFLYWEPTLGRDAALAQIASRGTSMTLDANCAAADRDGWAARWEREQPPPDSAEGWDL